MNFPTHVPDRSFDVRAPLLVCLRCRLKGRDHIVALVADLVDSNELEIPNPQLQLYDALFEVLRTDVSEDGSLRVGGSELIQRGEARINGNLLLPLRLIMGDSRSGRSGLGGKSLL